MGFEFLIYSQWYLFPANGQDSLEANSVMFLKEFGQRLYLPIILLQPLAE
jgi:hypothetical protein